MLDFVSQINRAEKGKLHLFSLGQAGFIAKNSFGKLLGIDLYLSDCVEHEEGNDGYKRLLPKILDPKDIDLDVLICTHFHRDHFDVDSVPLLMKNNNTLLLCPNDCREDVINAAIEASAVRIISPGDSIDRAGYKITVINCDHGDRTPDAVGVIFETDGIRIAEVGDTCLRLDRVGEILRCGKVNVLIAPINGAYGNMNEDDCVKLTNAVEPDLVIPCHYGMFAAHGGDPGVFRETMLRRSKTKYMLMTQGEKITF